MWCRREREGVGFKARDGRNDDEHIVASDIGKVVGLLNAKLRDFASLYSEVQKRVLAAVSGWTVHLETSCTVPVGGHG